MIMFPSNDKSTGRIYPPDGLLQARGIIQLDDIHNPKHVDANGEQCLLVVKNGLTTGTTLGRVSGMELYTRVYVENEIKEFPSKLLSSLMGTQMVLSPPPRILDQIFFTEVAVS
ncbi:hypothetical protein H2248_002048 [Termitomyces sp. 'cryptogamus']|nr:hypothetical protein H2248_002048 [Termitomyces sp. 'cryptogamus']